MISFGIGKEAKKITLHYVSNLTEYENSNIIEIEDFDDFYIYYEAYSKKQRIKECQECGKLILVKGIQQNGKKYCEDCALSMKTKKTVEKRKINKSQP